MNFTYLDRCPACGKQSLGGNGGQYGGRITIVNKKCAECDARFILIPVQEKYRYEVKATTEDERKEERIEKLKADNALKLAEEINNIRNR